MNTHPSGSKPGIFGGVGAGSKRYEAVEVSGGTFTVKALMKPEL